VGAVALVALAGCGGGSRQDAHEASADFKVQIVGASFPAVQTLAQASKMNITVRNADTHTIPNVGVTVDSFTRRAVGTADADPSRAIWIVDNGPSGGDTAYRSTWSLGPLAPGERKTFTWNVTAVNPGRFAVHYRVNAGLNGKAIAKLDNGNAPLGVFKVFTLRVAGAVVAVRIGEAQPLRNPLGQLILPINSTELFRRVATDAVTTAGLLPVLDPAGSTTVAADR